MFVGMFLIVVVSAVAALASMIFAPDQAASLVTSAAENVPCRPLTLECLIQGAGGLGPGVVWPPILPGPPKPPDTPYDEGSDQPDRTPREYAPEAPPGQQPPRPPGPQDALNDEAFKQTKKDWARENSDSFPTIPEPSSGMSAGDVLIESIRSSGSR